MAYRRAFRLLFAVKLMFISSHSLSLRDGLCLNRLCYGSLSCSERVDRIERILEFIVDRLLPEEEMSDEDREALKKALEEHRKGETIPLKEVLKQPNI